MDSSAGSGGDEVISEGETTGFIIKHRNNASAVLTGHAILTHMGGNKWVCSHNLFDTNVSDASIGSGVLSDVGGVLDIVRITLNGTPTDAFDAGSVNVLVL